MRLSQLLETLQNALASGELANSAPVSAFVRCPDTAFDSPDAWQLEPLTEVDVDIDEPSVDVLMRRTGEEPQLSVSEFTDAVVSLPAEYAEFGLFVGEWTRAPSGGWLRYDGPVIAISWDERGLGLILPYKGWQEDMDSLV